MKRSFIDACIDRALETCARRTIALPPFSTWGDQEFLADRQALSAAASCGLGWNVAEFAPGLFSTDGLVVFTLRMGPWRDLAGGRGRLYAEKLLFAEDGQRTPHHYHIVKTEDVINRGGGRFVVELFKVDAAGAPLKSRFSVIKDLRTIDLGPGDQVRLEPGESLTLDPFVAHAFWAEGGAVVAGEVSLANDDGSDNYFSPPFSIEPIEENAPRRRVTVADYAVLLAGGSQL